jgi:hypothetical protein
MKRRRIIPIEAQRASVIQPRVARSATLGPSRYHHAMSSNPNGVPSIVEGSTATIRRFDRRNPVGVRGQRGVGDSLPRVAASPQPWAQLRNPVGIWGTANLGCVISHHGPILRWTGLKAGCVIGDSVPILLLSSLKAQRASVMLPSSLEAQRASVIQPRVARSATLGPSRYHHAMSSNPNGVPSIVEGPTATIRRLDRRNPVGVRGQRGVGDSLPRVAASPQPWAQLRNPVGIWGTANLGCVISHHGPILRWTGLKAGCVIGDSVPILLLSSLKAQRASVMLPSSLEAQRASVIQPRVRRTLGDEQTQNVFSPNPNGVPSIVEGPTATIRRLDRRNPVGVRGQRVVRVCLPRVAASPQPWAILRNPVGIQKLLTGGTAE